MRFSVRLLVLIAAFTVKVSAATFSGQIVDLATGSPLANVVVEIMPRLIMDGRLLPFPDDALGSEAISDNTGAFSVEVDAEFVAVRVRDGRFAEYFNILAKSARFLVVELASEEPGAAESAIQEQRREAAQIEARAEEADSPSISAFSAAAQPVVPTDVRVVDLEGFTGMINLDEFISGVVSRELGDSFPYESLKAQAVAARTFALVRLRDRGQANGGQAYTSTLGTKSRVATHNSSGVALTYNSSYITAFFSARCNGDFTLDSEDGLSGLATCEVGGLVGRVIPYLRKVPCSGHVNCSQTSELCCDVTADGRAQHIYGHGVGLCQRGAQNFAGRDGFSWRQIIDRFYTSVITLPGNQLRLGDRIETTTLANRRTIPCAGTTASTPSASKGTIIAGPETIPCTLISGTSWVTWWRVAFDSGARGWMAEDFIRKTPAAQSTPTLGAIDVTLGSGNSEIAAQTRANLRLALEGTADFQTWTSLATNTASAAGYTTFSRPNAGALRFYRARLLLPDTAP